MPARHATRIPAPQTAMPAQRTATPAPVAGDHPLQRQADDSPRVNTLQALQHLAARPAQRAAADDEELLQGKSATAQRAAAEEDELLQGKFAPVQRAAVEDEELLQGRFARITGSPQPVLRRVDPTTEVNGVPVNDDPALEHEADVMGAKAAQFVAGPADEEPLQGRFGGSAQPQPNSTGLPDNLKAGVENLSGMSMDSVRVHYNSGKPAQLNALAYAQGTDIHLGPGQERHLPHEAWHVVQQKGGGRLSGQNWMAEGVKERSSLSVRQLQQEGGWYKTSKQTYYFNSRYDIIKKLKENTFFSIPGFVGKQLKGFSFGAPLADIGLASVLKGKRQEGYVKDDDLAIQTVEEVEKGIGEKSSALKSLESLGPKELNSEYIKAPWKEGKDVKKKVIKAGTPYYMIVNKINYNYDKDSIKRYGKFASEQKTKSPAEARDKLSILKEFKEDPLMLIQVKTIDPAIVLDGDVGPLKEKKPVIKEYPGGGHQVEFLGWYNLEYIKGSAMLPVGDGYEKREDGGPFVSRETPGNLEKMWTKWGECE